MRFHKLEENILDGWAAPLGRHSGRSPLAWFRESQKFYVGEVDRLPSMPAIAASDFPRTPYPACAFELVLRTRDDEPRFEEEVRVICLVHDDPENVMAMLFSWGLPRCMPWLYLDKVVINRSAGTYRFADIASFDNDRQPYITPELRGLERPGSMDGLDTLGQSAIFNLGLFLRVLNCVNVKTETVEAPAALNKKRLRNGKPPIYSYKTLVLRPSAAQRLDHGGTHESPRVHLRRGHIKHRKTGDFWWQPHVVGDRARGAVMKDYRADKLIVA
jgi:hypothetical protein